MSRRRSRPRGATRPRRAAAGARFTAIAVDPGRGIADDSPRSGACSSPHDRDRPRGPGAVPSPPRARGRGRPSPRGHAPRRGGRSAHTRARARTVRQDPPSARDLRPASSTGAVGSTESACQPRSVTTDRFIAPFTASTSGRRRPLRSRRAAHSAVAQKSVARSEQGVLVRRADRAIGELLVEPEARREDEVRAAYSR